MPDLAQQIHFERGADEPRSHIERGERVRLKRRHQPGSVGGSIHLVVVNDEEPAVWGALHIESYAIGTQL